LGNFFLGEFLDGDGGDDEAGFVHGSIRAMVYSYVLRQGIPMSCNHTLSARLCQPDWEVEAAVLYVPHNVPLSGQFFFFG